MLFAIVLGTLASSAIFGSFIILDEIEARKAREANQEHQRKVPIAPAGTGVKTAVIVGAVAKGFYDGCVKNK